MGRNIFVLIAALFSITAMASNSRVLDGTAITAGSASNVLTLPQTTDTLTGRATTDTLTNKSLSGASNTFTAIPVGAIGNGSILSGSNTGDVTLGTASGLSLSGQILSLQTSDATHTGALLSTDWVIFNNKLSNSLTSAFLYVGNGSNVATGVAASGDLTLANTGAFTLATVNSNVGSFTNANITVNAKGLITAASNGSSASPALNGGSAAPQSVSAAGGVSLSSIGFVNFVWVVGNGGAVTVTATPSVTACTADGQLLYIIGTDNTNTVTLQDAGTLTSSKLRLNGQWVGAKYSQLLLSCNVATTEWFEVSRR